MPQTIHSERIPIKLWLKELDEATLIQAKNLANLPFGFHHIAIMPDAHMGYGMPIGGVAATDGMIIPNAVGVDIGCGVCAAQTSLPSIHRATIKKILKNIRERIPLGFKHHKTYQNKDLMPRTDKSDNKKMPIVTREFDKGRHQLGTLGGGNHFIEIQKGDDGFIWIMIHSGSRNIGYQVAGYYNNLAKKFNKEHGYIVPPKHQLDSLPIDSPQGQSYFAEMNYCVEFARNNRKAMLRAVQEAFFDTEPSVTFADAFDIAHNYAAQETHYGKSVIVHRKGATRAIKGELGIIPGSQGNSSYIVRGKGNPESFSSCSHGAGRKLGRKQAQRQLNLQDEINYLERKGILHSIRSKKDLDEACGAYKNINEVIGNQLDLVEVITELHPLAVVKG